MQRAGTRVRGRRVGLVAADQGRRHYRHLADRPSAAGLGSIFQTLYPFGGIALFSVDHAVATRFDKLAMRYLATCPDRRSAEWLR